VIEAPLLAVEAFSAPEDGLDGHRGPVVERAGYFVPGDLGTAPGQIIEIGSTDTNGTHPDQLPFPSRFVDIDDLDCGRGISHCSHDSESLYIKTSNRTGGPKLLGAVRRRPGRSTRTERTKE
jgi:hypothetical protein